MQPLDERYFTWLYSRVGSVKTKSPTRTYWSLLRQLYSTEFAWFVPNDDNRVEDGKDLRIIFASENELDVDPTWLDLECSVLEMLLGLSDRLAYETNSRRSDWFWKLLENLELSELNDYIYGRDGHSFEVVSSVLERMINRTYLASGKGGLFPLRRPRQNQTRVEIWYQLNAYLLENG